MAKKESHEDFMKRTCGEDFWDKDPSTRFFIVLDKCVKALPMPMKELKRLNKINRAEFEK